VDTRDTVLAGEALENYLESEKNRSKVAVLSDIHKQNASRKRNTHPAKDAKELTLIMCRSGGMADAPDSKKGAPSIQRN
jgi:hypothetical protein